MSVSAKIYIDVALKCWYRDVLDRFAPTRNWTDDCHIVTTTGSYSTDVSTLSTQVYTMVANEVAAGNQVGSCHFTISLENATAAISGKGVVPMQKERLDCALSSDEMISATAITNFLVPQILHLIKLAEYN